MLAVFTPDTPGPPVSFPQCRDNSGAFLRERPRAKNGLPSRTAPIASLTTVLPLH